MTKRLTPNVVVPSAAKADDSIPMCEHVKPNEAFDLVHHHNWDFVANYKGGAWLPSLGFIWHVPGANGVEDAGKGKRNVNAARIGHRNKKGITIVNGEEGRLPAEFRNFLGVFKVHDPQTMQIVGRMYVLRGCNFTVLGNGKTALPVNDRQWEYAFRDALAKHGIVPGMAQEVLTQKVAVLENRRTEWQRKVDGGNMPIETFNRKSAELDAEIAAYEKAWTECPYKDAAPVVAPGDGSTDAVDDEKDPQELADAQRSRKQLGKGAGAPA